jgi:hypothetical protein
MEERVPFIHDILCLEHEELFTRVVVKIIIWPGKNTRSSPSRIPTYSSRFVHSNHSTVNTQRLGARDSEVNHEPRTVII